MAFILILCHCIVVLLELCIDNNQIQIFFFFLPATRVSFDGMPVRETYIQIGMALVTPRACTRGNVIGFVCRLLLAQKSPDLEI